MNKRDVKAIKVTTQPTNESEPRELTYEVVFFNRLNDLRSPIADKRKIGNEIGDGWKADSDLRHVLDEAVDSFIESLDRMKFKYTLLFDKDVEIA